MIEKIILDYLETKLVPPVYMEIPSNPPDEYVTIEKTGGGVDDYIKRATLAIQSHAHSLLRAAQINEDVKAAMDGAITLPEIAKSKLNSDYNFTDTRTKEYRYQAVYNIVF